MAQKQFAQPCHMDHDPKQACMLRPSLSSAGARYEGKPHASCMQQNSWDGTSILTICQRPQFMQLDLRLGNVARPARHAAQTHLEHMPAAALHTAVQRLVQGGIHSKEVVQLAALQQPAQKLGPLQV